MKCLVCKKENKRTEIFCSFCRYPLGVKKISEISQKELGIALDSLIFATAKKRKKLFGGKKLEQIYDELLYAYWLRPESALFRFVEAKILLGMKKKYLKYPVLDLGCGDGIFTSILFGGKINKNYDSYSGVDFSQNDVFNTKAAIPKDFFERKPPAIGFGLDIKENSAENARKLGVYDRVETGDARHLPFPNGSASSVFSNIIDDVKEKDLMQVFSEASRVLKKTCINVFTVPTENFKKYLFYSNRANDFRKKGKMKEYARFIGMDRGRSLWQGIPEKKLKNILGKTSFKMEKKIEYAGPEFIQLWDTGFRPFFHHLIALRNMLLKNSLYLPAKKVAVAIVREYFSSFARGQTGRGGAFAIIVVKKI